MATFTLSGSGTHAITAGTGALHVHVTTLPTIRGAGRAEPTNYYDLGLLRLGDGTYWWPSIPIDAEFQLLGCPQGTLEIAYALFNGTQLSVVEVAGANPLAGSRALEDLSDVLIASVANNDVLKWNASASKWENGTASTVATLEDLTDVLIASVANGQVLTWNSSAAKWENAVPAATGSTLLSNFEEVRTTDLLLSASFADVLTHSCAAGSWIFFADLQFSITSQSEIGLQLTDGSTVIASAGDTKRTGTDAGHIHLSSGVVSFGSTTTVHFQSRDSSGSASAKAAADFGGGNHATRLVGLQFG